MPEKIKFHSLAAILTFILLPPLWCLSVPAIIFSSEAKKFARLGAVTLARYFSDKSLKFVISSWLIFIILASAIFILYLMTDLSLI